MGNGLIEPLEGFVGTRVAFFCSCADIMSLTREKAISILTRGCVCLAPVG